VHRQAGGRAHGVGVRRHVGALEDDRRKVGSAGDEAQGGRDRRLLGLGLVELGARPSTGVSSRAPTARRWSAPSEAASAVTMPTRPPSLRPRSSSATRRRLDVQSGTPTAAAISRWNRDRKPQLVVIAATPSPSSSRAATMNGASSEASRSTTTRRGEAPRTVR
jgi:hypothetical protein